MNKRNKDLLFLLINTFLLGGWALAWALTIFKSFPFHSTLFFSAFNIVGFIIGLKDCFANGGTGE